MNLEYVNSGFQYVLYILLKKSNNFTCFYIKNALSFQNVSTFAITHYVHVYDTKND